MAQGRQAVRRMVTYADPVSVPFDLATDRVEWAVFPWEPSPGEAFDDFERDVRDRVARAFGGRR